ncbi:hypothetical protein E3U55_15630 [Filobacillus milosensis]|uniref:Uncharacterized protein n=1 Tax=Filobacillus milosensis TaxID=94137 RepID=A0A4Y8ICP4_9BACI|nr:hypothetical protein [Filobacillus milosensis]TFB13685.1 hypothetical protein E3U55_15630 [Filobacillus milosensis]
MNENIEKLFDLIETSTEFSQINNSIRRLVFTLYSKSRRLYSSIHTIKVYGNPDVNVAETLPLFRVLLESYFLLS